MQMKKEYIKNGREANNMNKNAKPERNKKRIVKITTATTNIRIKDKVNIISKGDSFLAEIKNKYEVVFMFCPL